MIFKIIEGCFLIVVMLWSIYKLNAMARAIFQSTAQADKKVGMVFYFSAWLMSVAYAGAHVYYQTLTPNIPSWFWGLSALYSGIFFSFAIARLLRKEAKNNQIDMRT